VESFEKLGVFYLGRIRDPEGDPDGRELLLYDSKDLTTHAICVGMTGSGKTGLCLSLLEEAALDGIPAIAIDPKGDLGNLLLSFPRLDPSDFRPWVDESEAARQGISPEELASRTAEKWKEGLSQWGEDGGRIERMRSAADFAIYTPGSTAGLSLSLLQSFSPPPAESADGDAVRERLAATVAGLLALLGIDADPVKSRETILLSSLLQQAWQSGTGLDLPSLIRQVQSPPFDRIGVMDLESFYPAAERFTLSLQLNNLLASPGFSSWMEGEPLDVARLLWTREGKPRISILSIAHLSDTERMFFVTLLLNEVVSWMRTQTGTSSLRAILYMDEVFGYFPPTANPSSKLPMLTLMKQARAFGLGVVLATQNPVDLDYKGLSNAGTWILGRLQTERDKARVLEGLEGISSSSGTPFDRQKMEAILAGLNSRVFVLNNVHEDHPVIFESRWCMSYLRGPLTRAQIQVLMEPRKSSRPSVPVVSGVSTAPPGAASFGPGPAAPVSAPVRHVLPPGLEEFFIAWRGSGSGGTTRLHYRPALLGIAKVHFVHTRQGLDLWENVILLSSLEDPPLDSPWDKSIALETEPELETTPAPGSSLAVLPSVACKVESYPRWRRELSEALYRIRSLSFYSCAQIKQVSRTGESEGDFRIRLATTLREKRDRDVDAVRSRYASKLASLQDRITRAQHRVSVEQSQYDAQKMQTAISAGAAILGALFGRKTLSVGNLGRSTTAARGMGRAAREREDVGRAVESVGQLREDLAELQSRVESEITAIQQAPDAASLPLEPFVLHPKKSDIQVEKVVLVWAPWEIGSEGVALRRF
jgi:phage host-nuclease inhibitor protein Gam